MAAVSTVVGKELGAGAGTDVGSGDVGDADGAGVGRFVGTRVGAGVGSSDGRTDVGDGVHEFAIADFPANKKDRPPDRP